MRSLDCRAGWPYWESVPISFRRRFAECLRAFTGRLLVQPVQRNYALGRHKSRRSAERCDITVNCVLSRISIDGGQTARWLLR
jgi:hypothetical protein